MPPTNTPEPTEAPADEGGDEAAAGGDEGSATAYDAELVALGEQQFTLCAACHGADARGVPNLGKDLIDSEFVQSLTDEELLDFIKTGRPIWDPMNTTGVDMPPRGGNPSLTDDDILAIIAYIRTLAAGE